MEPRDIIVLTPSGDTDPSLAIAACRTGATGVLDLEFCSDPSGAETALTRLTQFARNNFGVAIRAGASELLSVVLALPAKPTSVILAGGDHPQLATLVEELHAAKIEVLFEAVSLSEATRGVELGVEGIVLKGHEASGRVGADTSFVLLQKWRQYSNRSGVETTLLGPRRRRTEHGGGLLRGVCAWRRSRFPGASRTRIPVVGRNAQAVRGTRRE